MLFKDSALLDRMFRVFDLDDDNLISFAEYLACLSTISNKSTKENKLKCKQSVQSQCTYSIHFCSPCSLSRTVYFECAVSFQIYDFDGDGLISVGDLTAVLAATLREYNLVIGREDIDHIVAKTMKEADITTPGAISLEE